MHDEPETWDALDQLNRLQDAVAARDLATLDAIVSDQMIWILPVPDNNRGKQEWIDASCSITWDWVGSRISRELDLGTVRVVEAWMELQRQPTDEERAQGQLKPLVREGVVVDVWTLENDEWRLISRQPQSANAY